MVQDRTLWGLKASMPAIRTTRQIEDIPWEEFRDIYKEQNDPRTVLVRQVQQSDAESTYTTRTYTEGSQVYPRYVVNIDRNRPGKFVMRFNVRDEHGQRIPRIVNNVLIEHLLQGEDDSPWHALIGYIGKRAEAVRRQESVNEATSAAEEAPINMQNAERGASSQSQRRADRSGPGSRPRVSGPTSVNPSGAQITQSYDYRYAQNLDQSSRSLEPRQSSSMPDAMRNVDQSELVIKKAALIRHYTERKLLHGDEVDGEQLVGAYDPLEAMKLIHAAGKKKYIWTNQSPKSCTVWTLWRRRRGRV